MFIDSHCHLNFASLRPLLAELLAEMNTAEVVGALCVSTTLEEFPQLQALVSQHANLWATVGVHPDHEEATEPSVEDLIALAAQAKVVAIGETGLDYYRLDGRPESAMEWQRERFRTHIRAACSARLPLIIHTRQASRDTLAILQQESAQAVGGVFHCFTETQVVAKAALDLGFYISFSGILTFKNAQELRDVARYVPLDRCLIETDSPYLAPVPYRGKVNHPAYVIHVAQHLAELKACDVELVAQQTTQNFKDLFHITL